MSEAIHAFDLLQQGQVDELPGVVAIAGDERFLKCQVFELLMPPDADVSDFAGDSCEWRDIRDELRSGSLFGTGMRRVLVSDADSFVSQHRSALEDYVANPSRSAVLMLDLGALPSNTKLYKAIVAKQGVINCRLPETKGGRSKSVDTVRLKKWVTRWAASKHHIKLNDQATEELVDLIGWELGLLNQEMAKLALFVEKNGKVDVALVDQVVGGWRTQTTWDMLDAAAMGNAAQALEQLDHLLQSGDAPQALFGSIAWSLRRFAAATRIYQRMERTSGRGNLAAALEQAGFRKWPKEAIPKAMEQLKQISRARATQLYRWLLDADLSLKGSHSSPQRARFALEKLIFQLARQR
ncbi:MAG: DNA polymerase III subunit delta [Planctomycetaceae bacterium]|nr:DNA polymerase III subunit delta [Planctomycetaceae bacterium]